MCLSHFISPATPSSHELPPRIMLGVLDCVKVRAKVRKGDRDRVRVIDELGNLSSIFYYLD